MNKDTKDVVAVINQNQPGSLNAHLHGLLKHAESLPDFAVQRHICEIYRALIDLELRGQRG